MINETWTERSSDIAREVMRGQNEFHVKLYLPQYSLLRLLNFHSWHHFFEHAVQQIRQSSNAGETIEAVSVTLGEQTKQARQLAPTFWVVGGPKPVFSFVNKNRRKRW